MKARQLYQELLKNERRTQLRMKFISGAIAFIFFAVFFAVFLGLEVIHKVRDGFRFQAGNCVVESSVLTGKNMSCACGISIQSCSSRYPCLKVFVRLFVSGRNEILKQVLLYNNIYDLGSGCTYGPPCKADEKLNFEFVKEFKRTKGIQGASYDCYFNPDAPREVVVDNSVHSSAAFHSFFWPSCVLLVGVCMIFKAFHLRKKITNIAVPDDITLTEERNNNGYMKIKTSAD